VGEGGLGGRKVIRRMQGFIYIAGSFGTVVRSKCGAGKSYIDNDPHFWTNPPTWGICRNDLRKRATLGDYIFFVLPCNASQPQCIFAYLKIKEKISHFDAYRRSNLRSKRMGNKSPNGNIIVDCNGRYNRFDANAHRSKFERIHNEYAVGDQRYSRQLSAAEIFERAPRFMNLLQRVFGRGGNRPIDFISRYGQQLSPAQVRMILRWLGA
jgi:hypothetical protein